MAGELDLARAASRAALATEGVSRLGSGIYAEAATYGAGEKVEGVVVRPGEVEVHIVAAYPLTRTIPELVAAVRERVASEVEGRRVVVAVDDLEVAVE